MHTTLTLDVILGVLAPALVAIITRAHWPSQVKRYAALGIYVFLALVAWTVTRFPTQGQALLAEMSAVIAAGQVAYTALKPTGILALIEQATTPARPGGGDDSGAE